MDETATAEGNPPRGYELRVVLLLGLAFGFAYFDRMSMTFLSPYVVEDLDLTNTQVGALGSGLSVAWALGAYFIGRWSDAVGKRKPFLLGAMIVFSFCSVLSGLAAGFGALFASRVVMGLVEGPFLPICLAIIAAASAESRKGLNVGIVQNFFGSAIGTALAPIVLVWLADHYGWRSAFYIAGIPGLILAFLVWRFIAEPPMPPREPGRAPPPLLPLGMLANRNIAICSALSCLMVGSLVIGSIFLPLFFTTVRGWEPQTMSFVMAVLGLCPGIGGVLCAWSSDRIGRRPPMIAGCFLAVVCPLAALFFTGSIPALTALMFLSWLGIGVFPLFMGLVPGETLGHAQAATAMGLVVGVGELSGGFLGPLIGGKLADLYGLQAPLWIQAGLALLAGVVAFGLVETNPRVIARRTAGAAGMNDTVICDVEATMPYVVRGEKATFHAGDRAKSYWPVEEHRVTIHDVRPEIPDLALERNGFVVADEPTDVTDFTDQAELARYCRATEGLVQRLTGADKVISFGPMIRTNASGAHGHNQPAHGAHVDYGLRTVSDFTRDLLPAEEAERRLQGRFMLINVWRPIVMVESTPLAVCDARTVRREDLFDSEVVGGLGDFKRRSLWGFNLAFQPDHRWYWVPHMQPWEALVFKLFDSDEGAVQFTAHSAFEDPNTPPDAAPRQSIELRTIAYL